MTEGGRFAALEYGVECVARPGELASGDLYVVRETPTGVLISVIDGLGHGADAVAASRLAAATIQDHVEEPIVGIAEACNRELRKTRGVVMALVAVDSRDDSLTWVGVGNVEGILVHTDPGATPPYEILVMRPGVVGYHLPPLVVWTTSISSDDVLVLSTDGIRSDYFARIAPDLRYVEDVPGTLTRSGRRGDPAVRDSEGPSAPGPAGQGLLASLRSDFSPRNLAAYIGTNYVKGSDDALVLVAKYHGRGEA